MTNKQLELIKEVKRLIEQGRGEQAIAILNSLLEDGADGAVAFDGGGSNPPGPGQPGKP